MGVTAPGATVCCACMHEAQSRRRQRVPRHTLPLTDPTKSCAVTVRCMTLSFANEHSLGTHITRRAGVEVGVCNPGPRRFNKHISIAQSSLSEYRYHRSIQHKRDKGVRRTPLPLALALWERARARGPGE